jgi:signal transduction histidine kinase
LIVPTLDRLSQIVIGEESLLLINRIKRQVSQMDSLVDRFLRLRRGEEAKMELVQASTIGRLAAERLQVRRKESLTNRVKIEVNNYVSNKLLVWVRTELIDTAVDAVLDNAVDALENSRDGTIKVMTKANHNQTEAWIDIWNSGETIPEDTRENIFEVFHTTKDKGTGLGLFFARSYIELIGGSLDYISTDEYDGLFRVRLTGVRKVKSLAAVDFSSAADAGWL